MKHKNILKIYYCVYSSLKIILFIYLKKIKITKINKLDYNLLGYIQLLLNIKINQKTVQTFGLMQIWMKKHGNMFEQTNK